MLILHQTGSVRVGEVVRYTLTYTPSLDRILPPPSHLYVKIKNTSAVPLRAAYLHGPYTLYVACYPSTFDPFVKQENCDQEGVPEYEPLLKAGGHWLGKLTVPEDVRKDAETSFHRKEETENKSFTWIIEIASQILFSTTAAVHFELLVGRDEKSVNLGFHGMVGTAQGIPGRLEDHQQGRARNAAHAKGVFSKAIKLVVDDTESLWNTPPFPEWDDKGGVNVPQGPQHGDMRDASSKPQKKHKKQQKIHLVIVTHGIHSNTGADLLFIKESIDTAAKQAKKDAKKSKDESRVRAAAEANDFGRDVIQQKSKTMPDLTVASPPAAPDEDPEESDEDDEQVLVRGFTGNAVKTEKGIQYLGKRLAKYVLSVTYPDQPYLPVKSSITKKITRTFTGQKLNEQDGKDSAHKHSSIVKDLEHMNHNLPYKITSISFVGHSLGGLTQTYAIAYIQKHSPEFFNLIKPINFVALASPFLGLSNENPVYVKFALDFGLVGRTGQDLGLTWRTPTVVKSSWGAMVGGFTADASKENREPDPGSKPLLRILPTGPAHSALQKFRNRTVYSNVVNDGIVPLRTSCLLFLDWRGLGRVEKARRDNGLVGTMFEWGWAEITGQNASAIPRKALTWNDLVNDSGDEASTVGKTSPDPASAVPQADASQSLDYSDKPNSVAHKSSHDEAEHQQDVSEMPSAKTLWQGVMSYFRPQAAGKSDQSRPRPKPTKTKKIYRRGQAVLKHGQSDYDTASARSNSSESENKVPKRQLVRGSSLYTNNSENGEIEAPPKTTIFESAGDVLNPPLPPSEFLLDPSARPRTIFHDRVYHPDDIPPPPTKRPRTFMRRNSSRNDSVSNQAHSDMAKISSQPPEGGMKIEEKIARAYHKDMSWRKVLVSLEPDAHNNMVVRRMFANAYGWPVVKHMCDTHFGYTAAARTADEDESPHERAKSNDTRIGAEGEQVEGQVEPPEEANAETKHKLPDRAHSTDNLEELPTTTDTVQQDLQKLHSHTRKAKDKVNRDVRSPSEIRESRDEISDLVSLVSATGQLSESSHSSLNSSKTALTRLARKDSARWSDRFFDSDDEDYDDEDDNEAYLIELQKARERGEHITEEERKFAERISSSPKSTKLRAARSNTSIKTSSRPGSKGKAPVGIPPPKLLSETTTIVAEPTDIKSDPHRVSQATSTSEEDSKSRRNSSGAELHHTRTLTDLGLGKTVEDRIVPDSPDEDKTSPAGVAQQVALAHARSNEH